MLHSGGSRVMSEILRADITDAAAILELQKHAYQCEAALYNDYNIPPLTQTLNELKKEFAEKKIFKTVDTGRIVGSVRAITHNGACHIGRLIVHPEFQHRGIGTQLMLALESAFPLAGRFELFTGALSEGNIRLYKRLGYRIFRTDQLSPKVELVFMEKLRG